MTVEQDTLAIYRLDLDRLFAFLLGGELRLPAGGIHSTDVAGMVWNLGTARLSNRGMTSVWFARRLSNLDAAANLLEAAAARPSPDLRLLLTSTRRDRLSATHVAVPMTVVVSIYDVVSEQAGRIDFATLQARFDERPFQLVSGPLHLSSDNRVLTIKGNIQVRLKGKIQREIARLLVECHKGKRTIRATEILEEANSQAKSFDQALGKSWVTLKLYLRPQGDGFWHFEF